MKKFVFCILMCLMLIGCGNNDTQNSSPIGDEESITVEESSDTNESITGFEKADFDKYNSYASENGLGGKKIYIEGIVDEKVIIDDTIAFVLKQNSEDKWIITVGLFPIWSDEKIDEIMGKKIRVFGEYVGYSDKVKMPNIELFSENITDTTNHIEIIGNNKEGFTFLASDKQIIDWYHNNAPEILYTNRDKYVEEYVMSSGIIFHMNRNLHTLELIQNDGEELLLQKIDGLNNCINGADLDDYVLGDAITLYYYVTNGDIVLVSTSKVNLNFTLDEWENSYKQQFQEYSYEDIARNPQKVIGENAKVTGTVIQVLENGLSVVMRVNIAKQGNSYNSNIVYVEYRRKSNDEDRILEGDIVDIYGTLNGLKTYNNVLGAEESLPFISAEYVDIKQ